MQRVGPAAIFTNGASDGWATVASFRPVRATSDSRKLRNASSASFLTLTVTQRNARPSAPTLSQMKPGWPINYATRDSGE